MPRHTPCAPSARAAAIPRPSAMPPAAITGTLACEVDDQRAPGPTWQLIHSCHLLTALGDEHVRPRGEGGLSSSGVTDRLHPDDAAIVRARNQLRGHPHVERDHPRAERQ